MATNLNGCPYRGLDPYKEVHQEYFFGRERDTERIASNLFVAPLTVLYGSSGVGKSSVLQAGAIPHLRENEKCVVVFFGEWQADTFNQALKKEVLQELTANLNAPPQNATAAAPADDNGAKKITEESILQSIGEALQKKTTPTLDSLKLDELLVGGARAFNRRILIIFDQFEEYFLYHAPTKGSAGFDAEFARAVNQQDSDVNFMLAIREEELSKLDRFKRRIPTLLSNLLRLDHLDDQAAHNAIEKPLEVYNKKHPSGQMGIDPLLVTEIIRQVQPQPAAVDEAVPTLAAHVKPPAETGTKIETPFLQLVLVKLWQAENERKSSMLRLKTFEELGGAKQIAHDHLDLVMGQLTDQQRAVAASVLRFLVTPKGSKIALDPATLAGFANLAEEDVVSVLTRLSFGRDMRILRKVTIPGQAERYELFHDVLGPAILEWRARYVQAQRVDEEREEVKRTYLLERQRRMRQGMVVLVALLLIMIGLTGWALVQRSDANSQRAEAERQAAIARDALLRAKEAQELLQKEKEKVEEERDKTEDKARLLEISEAKARTNEQDALAAKAAAVTARQTAEDEKDRADKQAKLVTALNEIMDLDLYGFDAIRAGDADRALEFFTQALEKTRQQKDRSMEAYNLLNIGDSYAIRGGVLQADQLRTFDLLKDKLEDTEAMVVNLYATTVGRDAKKLKEDKDKAQTYYNHAMDFVRAGAAQNARTEAVLNQRLGDLFLTAEIPSVSDDDRTAKPEFNFANAIEFYEKASAYLGRSSSFDLQGILLNRIGILLSLDDDNVANVARASEYYERAKSAFENALALSRDSSAKSKLQPKQASVLFKLGDLYSKGPNKDVAKAIGCYEGAAKIYESLERFDDQADMLSLVADLSAGVKNADQAFASYGAAHNAFQRAANSGTDRARAQAQNKALEMLTKIGSVYGNDPAQRGRIVAFYESVIPTYNQDASAKAGILHKIADIFRTGDKTVAITYLARESLVYQQAVNHLKEGDVLVDIGLLYRALKDDDKSREHFERARAAYNRVAEDNAADNRSSLISSYMTIARSYTDEGDKLSAVRTYVEALNKTRPREKDKASGDYRITDIGQLGSRLLVDLRPDLRDEEATKFFQALFNYHQFAADPYGASEGGALETAARYYTEVTNPRRALEYYKQAREAYQRKNYFYQFDVLKRIGKVYFTLNDQNGAASYFDEAVRSYAQRTEQASALVSIGWFYAEAGMKREAVSAYEKALQARVEAKDISGQASLLRILSGLYKELGDLEKAAELARQADALVVKR